MRRYLPASLLTIMFSCLLIGGCAQRTIPSEYVRTEPVMDTFVQVKVSDAEKTEAELEAAVTRAFLLAEDLTDKLNVFDSHSEVNRLNMQGKLKVSSDLLEVLIASKELSEVTAGEFDITVAPMLKKDGLYRNMPGEILGRIPDSLDGVGSLNVVINYDTVVLENSAWIDLSGIAKGYIVDKMAAFLRAEGIENIMVNAGGDIYCGEKPGGKPWRVGVRRPGATSVVLALDIKDAAVATSGDYENIVQEAGTGEILSHIVDPRSGKAIGKGPSSVTVIAFTCQEADALATGMMAMGAEGAVKLADSMRGIEMIYISEKGGKQEILMSEGAEKFVVK